MPESPDFESIAREMAVGLVVLGASGMSQHREAFARDLAEQFRQVWNARGAADIESTWRFNIPGDVEEAIRSLDR